MREGEAKAVYPAWLRWLILHRFCQFVNGHLEHLLLTNVLNARYTFLAYSVVIVLVSFATGG